MIGLDFLEAAAKAATPGPWGHYGHRPHINVPDEVRAEDGTVIVTVHNDCDAAYIAAANPAVVLELIAELRKAQAERDWVIRKVGRGYERNTTCPNRERQKRCAGEPTAEECCACWLNAASEAVEEKK